MNLSIDLNKLSLKELDIILKIAKKQGKSPIEQVDDKPKFRSKSINWDYILPKMKEYISQNKHITLSKLLQKFNMSNCGRNYHRVKIELGSMIKKKEVKEIIPKEVDKRYLRQKYIMNSLHKKMKFDRYLTRTEAYWQAVQDWENRCNVGSIHEMQKFDWTKISLHYPKESRDILINAFRQNKAVTFMDTNYIGIEEVFDFHNFAQKIITNADNILHDLNLKGKIVYQDFKLYFKGNVGNFTPAGVVELGLNGSATATPKVSPEEKPIV